MSRINCGIVAFLLTIGWSANSQANLITNGDFATGDFTGWSLATTDAGTLGPSPPPQVTSFDVTGSGATNAAQFQVGRLPGVTGGAQGGSISQDIVTGAGTLHFSASIASFASNGMTNGDGGTFSVLLDGVTLDTIAVGRIEGGEIVRDLLFFSEVVGAGDHTLEILMTRIFQSGNTFGPTPFQYVTNVNAKVTEPATLALVGAGVALAGIIASRRKGASSPV